MASSINNPPWMEWVEKLMEGTPRQSYASTFPPERFYCLLDELPLHLIPRRELAALRDDPPARPLVLNSGCILCRSGVLPSALSSPEELFARFALQGSVAWVPSASGSLLPFWLGPRLDAFVQSLREGEPVFPMVEWERVDWDLCQPLLMAGILVVADRAAERSSGVGTTLAKSAQLFRTGGYVPLGGLIHPFHIAALRRYYRYLIRTGAVPLGDGQSARRYVAYNDPVARFFHRQICATLSAVAGEELKPSYVYLASYRSGAELKKHTDREQCEYSVTFCLDFSPEPQLETPWPIRLDTPAGTTTVYQSIGDGLAYRGTRLPHYRDALGIGQTSTSIFFHYVPADFSGSLD
jgi:hypothetical protein